jgi:type 1 glutamine amidotransferase
VKNLLQNIVATAVIAGGVASFAAHAQTGNPGGAVNDHLGAMEYGVCRGTDPVCFHDWPRPASDEYRVLLFTKTAGPRHAHLGTALPAGLNPELAEDNVVQRELGKLLAAANITMHYTEDGAVLNGLTSYHAVIFFSTSRDNLNDGEKTALRQYMRRGGGFVGVHNAFGTQYNWPYYEGLLGGANFFDHGPHRVADVVLVNTTDASTRDLPERFTFMDEWYNLIPFPTQVRFLATVDENSMLPPPPRDPWPMREGRLPSVLGSHPGHGSFHPVTWCQYYDGGKSWVTTLGHDPAIWTDPDFKGGAQFKTMLLGGVKSVMGLEPFCQ